MKQYKKQTKKKRVFIALSNFLATFLYFTQDDWVIHKYFIPMLIIFLILNILMYQENSIKTIYLKHSLVIFQFNLYFIAVFGFDNDYFFMISSPLLFFIFIKGLINAFKKYPSKEDTKKGIDFDLLDIDD